MIYLECHLDTYLLEFLGYVFDEQFIHSGSKGQVLKGMSSTTVSLGIIDQDPAGGNHYPQLKDYKADTIIFSHNLRLFENQDKPTHKLIEIPDELEIWLEILADQTGYDLSRSGLLKQTGGLKKIYNNKDRRKLERLFIHLQSNSVGFHQFERWVTEFHE